MPNNDVVVNFIGNPKPLYATADATPAKLAQSGDAAGKAYATAFEKQLAIVQSRVGASPQDQQIFRNIQRASAESEAAIYRTQQAAAFERSKVKLAIYRAEKAAELGLEEQTAGKVKQIRGFGAVFRAVGLHSIGITESEINAGIALYNNYIEKQAVAAKVATAATATTTAQAAATTALATSEEAAAVAGGELAVANTAVAATAETAAAAEGSLAAIAASLGGLGIAGALVTIAAGAAIVYHITKDIADAEKQKLKYIEDGAKASNKAILAKQAEAQAYKDAIAAQEHQFQLTKQIEAADSKRLQELLRIAEVLGKTDDALKIRAALLQNPDIKSLDTFRKEYNQRQDFEKQLREQEKKNAEIAAKERIDKIREVAKATEDFFQSSSQRANANNPFFKILSDAQELEKQINKLNPAFQTLARTQAGLAASNALFGAKIDNVLGVSDLRQQASFFRNGQKGETTDDLLRRLGFNPDQFKNLSDAQKANFATQFGSQQAIRLANASKGGSLGGVNLADLALGSFRNAQQKASTEETVQQRLDRQFKSLESISPSNEAQRAVIDRKIATLAQGVDPTSLRQDTRNRVADSIERNADNLARQQADATKAIQKNTAILNRLNANLEKQINRGAAATNGGAAATNGSTSVELVLKNESSFDIGATPTPRNPSPADVNSIYGSGDSFFNGQ